MSLGRALRATIIPCAVLTCTVSLTIWRSEARADGTDFAAVLDVCEATTLDEAAARGARLGWAAEPEDRDWRAAWERTNGGTVRVIGWRAGGREGDGLLSFWVASGQNALTACSFGTSRPGLLEALRDRFGAPQQFEAHDDVVSASWRRGAVAVYFARVRAASTFGLSRPD